MSELSRQGMVKANTAAIEASHTGSTWSIAEVVRAAIEAYVAEVYPTEERSPQPWDNCTDPRPSRTHMGYCETCHGIMIASAGKDEWVHPES